MEIHSARRMLTIAVTAAGLCASPGGATTHWQDWEWVSPRPSGAALVAGAVGDGTVVLVGGFGGGACVSDDGGSSWEFVDTGVSDRLGTVVWTGERFIAGGGWAAPGLEGAPGGGVLITSEDGRRWTVAARVSYQMPLALYWDGRQAVAVGVPAFVATSPDGLSWTQHPGPPDLEFARMEYLTKRGDTYLGFGLTTELAWQGGEPRFFTSPDGVSWSASWPEGLATRSVRGIFAAEGTVLALGYGDSSDGPTILISSDGEVWTEHVGADTLPARFEDVIWFQGRWVAVDDDGQLYESRSGESWSSWGEPVPWDQVTPSPHPASTLVGLPDGLVVAGGSGLLGVTADALDWHVPDRNQATNDGVDFVDVTRLGEVIVAVGDFKNVVTSSDGEHWESTFLFGDGSGLHFGDVHAVRRLRERAWLVGSEGLLASTGDGRVWQPELPEDEFLRLRDIADDGTRLVACGTRSTDHATAVVATSDDGLQWTVQEHPELLPFPGSVVAFGGRFLAFSWVDAKWAASIDGASWWPLPSLDSIGAVRSAATDGRRVVVVGVRLAQSRGTEAVVLTSPDGEEWSSISFPEPDQLDWVRWTGDQFLAVGPGAVLTSSDGVHWTVDTIPGAMRPTCMIRNGDDVLGLGRYGSIVRAHPAPRVRQPRGRIDPGGPGARALRDPSSSTATSPES